MRAIIRETYGGPEQLKIRDTEIPTPGSNDVRIRVRAFGVNRAFKTFDLRPFTVSRHRCGVILDLKTCEQCHLARENGRRGEKSTAQINRTRICFVNHRSPTVARIACGPLASDTTINGRPCRYSYLRAPSDLNVS